MTRCDGPPSPLVIFLCSARANLQFFPATFSIRLFTSPALTHVYIPFFWHGVSLPSSYKLKRISDDRVWPFILLIRDAPSVLVALWERISLLTIAVVSSTKLLRSCFTFPYRRPVSKISLVSFISHLLRQVGIDPFHYSGHSFRIGGSTSASLAGLTDYEIKLLGRWNSDFYQRYTRSPFSCCSIYPARLHKRTRWSFSTPLLTSSMNLLQITN